MDDLHLKQTEKRCFSVLSGTSKNSEEFMDSPTFFLSRAAMRDRLWLLIFLEALIAIENGSEEYFETDYIMAVNEYLVRRSDLSVRMLNTWIGGQNFRSMQEVTDFFNDRYRVTGQFFRERGGSRQSGLRRIFRGSSRRTMRNSGSADSGKTRCSTCLGSGRKSAFVS